MTRTCIVLAALIASAAFLPAQSFTGSLSGRIHDPQQAAVPVPA